MIKESTLKFVFRILLSFIMGLIATFIFLIYDILGLPWFVGTGAVVGFITLIELFRDDEIKRLK